MDISSITLPRLYNQQLVTTKLDRPQDVVSWMGAIQSQDLEMAKWAIGLRLPEITYKQVEEAMNRGDIVRTHILRPTWHFIASEDIYWILELSAQRVLSMSKSYDKDLGFTDDFVLKTNLLLTKILENNANLTKEEIGHRLRDHGIECNTHTIRHILFKAELQGIVCSGTVNGREQTYDLLERKIVKTSPLCIDRCDGNSEVGFTGLSAIIS
jgi:hypothetical protein